jgi:hypothetical protein
MYISGQYTNNRCKFRNFITCFFVLILCLLLFSGVVSAGQEYLHHDRYEPIGPDGLANWVMPGYKPLIIDTYIDYWYGYFTYPFDQVTRVWINDTEYRLNEWYAKHMVHCQGIFYISDKVDILDISIGNDIDRKNNVKIQIKTSELDSKRPYILAAEGYSVIDESSWCFGEERKKNFQLLGGLADVITVAHRNAAKLSNPPTYFYFIECKDDYETFWEYKDTFKILWTHNFMASHTPCRYMVSGPDALVNHPIVKIET